MKKVLRMTAVFTGIISVASAIILVYIYVENLFGYFGTVKNRITVKTQKGIAGGKTLPPR